MGRVNRHDDECKDGTGWMQLVAILQSMDGNFRSGVVTEAKIAKAGYAFTLRISKSPVKSAPNIQFNSWPNGSVSEPKT